MNGMFPVPVCAEEYVVILSIGNLISNMSQDLLIHVNISITQS